MTKTLGYAVEPTLAKSNLPPGRRLPGSPGDVCPACGGSEACVLFAAADRLCTSSGRFQIVECTQCRLIRLDPQPTPEELGACFPSNYWSEAGATGLNGLEGLYRRLVMRDHLRFVERAWREAESQGILLDAGYGSGLMMKMLAERADKAGRDGKGGRGSAKMASLNAAPEALSRHSGIPAICGTLSKAPFAPGSCAVITMFQVIEHLYDPAGYLHAAWNLLAPGGRLIIQAPNAASWQFLLFGERWSGLDVPRRVVHFRLKEMENLLESCGFKILRSRHFSIRDNPQGMASSVAPMLDPTARRLRRVIETPRRRLAKDLAFFTLVAACLPFTVLEAACRAGSTVMIEARKK
jgi:SAM-dependent methyltransferase